MSEIYGDESPGARPGEAELACLGDAMRRCRLCVDAPRGAPLPHPPRPIFAMSGRARLVIASQAPGARAHRSGIPFQDPSGDRLRQWLGLGPELFYDASRLMILPMGFCFPGYDAAMGDKPPRPECRATWHFTVFAALPQVEVILAVGLHAIRWHLGRLTGDSRPGLTLTELVAGWRDIRDAVERPRVIPLPHPSWRNTAWLRRHPFFEAELLPEVRAAVQRLVVEAPPA